MNFTVKVPVKNPTDVVRDSWKTNLDVNVDTVNGENAVKITGMYESVTAFMVEVLNMSPQEANARFNGDDMRGVGGHVAACEVCGEPMESEPGEFMCPMCSEEQREFGAAESEEALHDYDDDMRMDRRRFGENVEFDKFMDNILLSEGHFQQQEKKASEPQRERAARRQERPLGRIRFTGKR